MSAFWHCQEILSRAQPCICVWPYPELGPNLVPPCPLLSIPPLLKDHSCSASSGLWCCISGPQHLPELEHPLPGQKWVVRRRERFPWDPGSVLFFIVSWAAGWQPGPCWVQSFFWIYSSDIPHAAILLISFPMRKKKKRDQKEVTNQECNWMKMRLKKEKGEKNIEFLIFPSSYRARHGSVLVLS